MVTREEWCRYRAQYQGHKGGWATVAVLAFDLLAFAGAWELQSRGGWFGFFGILLLTLALLHAYLFLHEASHSAVNRRRAVNDLVGHLSGWVVLMPFRPRQRSHLLHHTWAGHPRGDPSTDRLIRRFAVLTRGQAERLEFIWRYWIPLVAVNERIGLWRELVREKPARGGSRKLSQRVPPVAVYLAGYAVVLLLLASIGKLDVLARWYLPALLLTFALEELVNLPHHAETPLLKLTDKALPYWEQTQVTHSCKSLPIWSRLVLLNFNLHTAHHLFPWVPWSDLPAVHRELCKHYPKVEQEQHTRNELAWSLKNRRRPILKIMGHYFDRIPKAKAPEGAAAALPEQLTAPER